MTSSILHRIGAADMIITSGQFEISEATVLQFIDQGSRKT
jgi:hypothetical protein